MEFDDSGETIRTVALLAGNAPTDVLAAGAISALCHSRKPLARTAVWNFVRTHAGNPDPRALALSAALPPLARESRFPVESVVVEIVAGTGNGELMAGAVESLLLQPASPGALEAVATAWRRSGAFPPGEASRIRKACRRNVQRLAPELTADGSGISESVKQAVQEIRNANAEEP
jgi:hypothetical protein